MIVRVLRRLKIKQSKTIIAIKKSTMVINKIKKTLKWNYATLKLSFLIFA